jgi:hypothetical protein
VARSIFEFGIFVIFVLSVFGLIVTVRDRDLWSAIVCAIAAAIGAAVLVFSLLNPTEVQLQQLEKPEGWNVIWLGPHVAIELFGGDAVVTVYGPYCD